MKKHDYKHIEIVAAGGFSPAELKMLQTTLENALREVGRKTTVDVRSFSGKQGMLKTERKAEEIAVMSAPAEKREGDVFEEALICVEAL